MRIHRMIKNFCEAQNGGILIMTAAAIFVLLLLIGGFTDFGVAMLARSQIHGSQDAAALAAAVSPVVTKLENGETVIDIEATQDAKKAVAERYYTANYEQGLGGSNVAPSDLTVEISADGATVTISNSADVPTHFLPLADIDEVSIARTTMVSAVTDVARFRDADIVMVIDSSGSMKCSQNGPQGVPPPPDTPCNRQPNEQPDSRSKVTREATTLLVGELMPLPGEPENPDLRIGLAEYGTLIASKNGLSSSRNTVLDYVQNVTPDKLSQDELKTCGACGMVAAQEIFAGNPTPLPPPRTDDTLFSAVKVVIFLTDGIFNTLYSSSGQGSGRGSGGGKEFSDDPTGQSPPFQQFREKCSELKQDGVSIYTVGFGFEVGQPNSPLETTLAECASLDASGQPQSYLAPDAPALMEAFKHITESISKVRITR